MREVVDLIEQIEKRIKSARSTISAAFDDRIPRNTLMVRIDEAKDELDRALTTLDRALTTLDRARMMGVIKP